MTELLEGAADAARDVPHNISSRQSLSPTQPARGRVHVDAKPVPISLDPRKTAVIVVDMQKGFFGAEGAWDRQGVELSAAQAIVAPIARVLAAAPGGDAHRL
jgi:ureidoacrylate peracid hydrolase